MDLSTLFYLIIHIDKYPAGYYPDLWVLDVPDPFCAHLFRNGLCDISLSSRGFASLYCRGVCESGSLNVEILIITLCAAAVLGDSVNYWIAKTKGMKVLEKHVKKGHLEKTEEYFSRYGGLTIIIARFIPYIRTVAPFLAGVGRMNYRWFITYNIVGAVLWSCTFILAGYFVGSLPIVQEHFNYITLAILGISILIVGSIVVGFLRKKNDQTDKNEG